MGLSSSIQFRDIDSVTDAFNNRSVEAWSISQGKQFMFKGIGSDSFVTILKTLNDGDTTALYTVRVYEDITNEKEIKSNTPDDGSFNFKLNEDLRENYRSLRGVNEYYGRSKESTIMQKLQEIETRLDEEERPAPVNELGIIGKLLENPTIAGLVPTVLELIVNTLTGTKAPVNYMPPQINPPPASQARNAVLNGINEDKIIIEVVEQLKTYDPNLARHLQKLLEIAQNDSRAFNLIIQSLDTMQ